MKKVLLFCAVALMSVFGVNAQDFGITGGFNSSTFANDDVDALAGFNVGVKLTDHFSGNWFWEGSALFSQKGYHVDGESLSIGSVKRKLTDDIDNKLYYLHVPINVGYDIPVTSNFSIAPKGGIYLAVGLWGDDGDDDPFSDYEDKYDYADVDNFSRFDFGFALGVNFNIAHHFQIGTGYEWGMIKVADDYMDDSQNRNFYANFAYIF